MRYGVSYYPEHKKGQELEHDIKLLLESGINTVRMGEFAWCRMEPVEGCYDFKWLKEVVNRLGKGGIGTILCTPTACPPAWLVNEHPEILYVDNRGVTRPFGGRRHYCYNNQVYRDYCIKIADALSKAFEGNPYIVGIQIDNEPAQEGTGRCTCDTCKHKFREYLAKKYVSIEEFNRRSGSIFWSQEYQSFDQINIPVNSIEVGAQQQIRAYYENPTIRLEFERFSSSSQIEFQNIQADIIRKHLDVPITTNATGLATNSINYYDGFEKLDEYTFDYYPGLRDSKVDSFPYAFARGIKGGTHFGVMEFMSGGGHKLGGTGRLQPNPGALKQAAVHSFALGSNLMLHFQFRTYPFGAEQLNYAIVDMDGVPRRRYREMCETAALFKEIEPLEDTSFAGEVAVCFDYDSHWALRIKPVNDPKFNYVNYCGKMYHMLEKTGVNADVVSLDSKWDNYRVVIIPSGIIMSEDIQKKIENFVKDGGTVIATFLTSVKNQDNVGYTTTLPAGLTNVFGSSVEEVEPVLDNHTSLRLRKKSCEAWCHMDETEDNVLESSDDMWSELLGGPSEAMGVYTKDYKEGEKVVSAYTYGKGRAYYIGTDLPQKDYCKLLEGIMEENKIHRVLMERDDKVEAISRFDEDKEYLFLFNFTSKETTVRLFDDWVDYQSKDVVDSKLELKRNGFKILERSKKI